MINLYLLCAELKDKKSPFGHKTQSLISDIYDFLIHPSAKTAASIAGWKEDFRYIYGDINTNLSSNSRLDKMGLLSRYHIYNISEERSTESLQMLFLAIQTFFSLLTKYIMADILRGIREEGDFGHKEILLGKFAEAYGIHNYCHEDWYCWPVYELDNGFGKVLDEMVIQLERYRTSVSPDEFRQNNNCDFIKQIYEAVIPGELRHALGEYYTPDWLAEATLNNVLPGFSERAVEKLSILDPTCGSGTFLMKAILYKRKSGCGLKDILGTVSGIDINPLAVLTAGTNYLLSVIDLLDGKTDIHIPVYKADILRLAESADVTDDPVVSGRKTVRDLKKADIVIGNPPWVNWEYLPEEYRRQSKHLWLDYGLFSSSGRELSFAKEDISVLVTYIVMDKFLKDGGRIAFVIRQGIFKSARNGVGFRRFKIRDDVPIKVWKAEDLSQIRVFENVAAKTAVFYAQKGRENRYPVPYYLWEKRADVRKCTFGAYSQLSEVMRQISVTQQYAMPAVPDDGTSPWITAPEQGLRRLTKILGTNEYRARTGVFTGGANAVYWLRVNSGAKGCVTVTNIVDRAKRRVERITTEIEDTYVYPLLRGRDVSKWNTHYDTYLLCPHTAQTRMWPVPQKQLQTASPKTYDYLCHFREELDERNGFAGWEREIQRQEFHAVLRVGEYTFSKYKVVWKYIAREFVCAVIGTVRDACLGEKLLLPNEKIMYVGTDDETEAYYLCGILSSSPVAECIKAYMNPTSISAHVLDKLNIPRYDMSNKLHIEIAALCREGHGKTDIAPYVRRIDELAAVLYGLKTKTYDA